MKTVRLLFGLLLIAVWGLAACAPAGAGGGQAQGAIRVLAVETFLADIAQNVAGDRAKVESLMPIGVDPHAFNPTPQDVRRVAESDVLILNGAGFEEFAEKMLENAGGERLVIEASAGLTMRTADEAMHDDHSIESHVHMVCAQLEGKQPQGEVTAAANPEAAPALHAEGEHAHEREIVTLKLNLQPDGTYAGSVRFTSENEAGYAFTSAGGQMTVATAAGAALTPVQALPLDCSPMTYGVIYKLAPGEYIVTLSGLTTETTPYSAGPVHAHTEAGADEHDHHHHAGDPHFWLDPLSVIKYVENIRDGLIAADPAGREVYTQNAAAYIAQLNDLHAWIETQVAQIPPERRVLVTDHDTLGYFADRYGFTVLGAIIPNVSSGASPTAQEMAQLIDQVKSSGAPAIFVESIASPQLANQVAAETGAKVVTDLYTHSVTAPEGKAPTYIAMMRHNVETMVAALK